MAAAVISGSVRLIDSRSPTVKKGNDFSGVVVWLDPRGAVKAATEAVAKPPARMIQQNKEFVPHVLAIPVGAAVEFPNYDPIFHNAFSTFSGQVFDVGLYPPGKSRTVVFRREGVVRVFCNIHPNMSAIIAVVSSPWFDVTPPSGIITISDVPPGEYQVRVFHERATQQTLDSLERRVTVTPAGLALPPIVISEMGYLAAPHKNKYGEDYPPLTDDNVFYPGARK